VISPSLFAHRKHRIQRSKIAITLSLIEQHKISGYLNKLTLRILDGQVLVHTVPFLEVDLVTHCCLTELVQHEFWTL
jgi:hypothetical protein